jgi:hypothetical protein
MGTFRSQVIPEEVRSTVMNLFRVPLNVMVMAILLKIDYLSDSARFALCVGLLGAGSIVSASLLSYNSKPKQKKE